MPETGADIAISVRDLVVGFGKKIVLNKLDLDVRRGEIIGLVGASGGGKSVLLRTIIGLTRQDRRYLRNQGASERQLILPSLRSLRHYSLRLLGEALGGRADRLPDWLTRRISLEGRAGFRPSIDA